jgi:AraC-like DNA-binding protein
MSATLNGRTAAGRGGARTRGNHLAAGIAALATQEGPNATRHPGVTVYGISSPQPPIPTLLMLQSGIAANAAEREVGYQSESQFSREFRRFFGAPPHAEAVRTLCGFGASS